MKVGSFLARVLLAGIYRIRNRGSKKFTDANRQIYEKLIETEDI